ncbi:MAG: peroxiredoxin [Sandaracinaceae bacterium]|nr:peroxiredoxin [Sandaracinaceae bacterium]
MSMRLARSCLVSSALALGGLASLAVSGCGGSQSGEAASASLAVGSPAPEIMLQSQEGRVRTLSEHRGHPVLVYFYPRDATPGCTQEACALRDAWDRLQSTGAVVYGVSTDDVASHRSFHDEHQLPFDLLSDPEETAARAYGVPVRMGFASRMSFLIDAQGNLARVFPDVDPAVHADEVLAAIQAL